MLKTALKIVLIYILLGLVWILLSKDILGVFNGEHKVITATPFNIANLLPLFLSSVLVFVLTLFLLRTKTTKAIDNSGEYFEKRSMRLFFDYFNDAAYIYELDKYNKPGKFLDVNQKMVEQLGYSKEELLQMYPYDILAPGAAEIIKRTEQELSKIRHHYLEIDHINNLGKKFPVEVSLHLFDINGGKLVFGTVKDIREQKKYIRKLRKAKEKAEESDRLKSAFLSNMSHEIRTPMNGIIGFSELIVQENLDNEQRIAYSGLIKRCTVQLLSIVNDILDISKIETDQMTMIESNCSVNSIMDCHYTELKQRISKRENIEIHYVKHFDNGNDRILSDQSRLHQVIGNLINNAEKFTFSGSIDFGYTLENNSNLKFWVKDTGIGIPDDKQEVVFERFRQADDSNTREFGGTGLGLPIAKGIVEQMGGKIWIESEIGKGTSIFFTIPYKKAENDHIIEEVKPIKETINFSGKTIFIVEDNLENSLLLEEIAKLYKIRTLKAFNGSEAISYLYQNNDIDLIFMDIRLPDISGIEVISTVKNMVTAPFVALTAYASPEDKIKCLAAGCDDYISKPVTRVEFERMLIKYLS
ncbi:MAG: response regulator [Bacteroidales bacterium]|nr:response regulator [Bacteroidales bacterium]